MTSKYGPETRLEKVNISHLIFKKLNAKKQHSLYKIWTSKSKLYLYCCTSYTLWHRIIKLLQVFDTESWEKEEVKHTFNIISC